MPSPSKHHTDIDSRGNIKIDYSSTYQENSILSGNLDGKIATLHKESYRKSVDRDDALKEARKEAETMDRLSSAIKRGEIKDSVTLYERSHTSRSRQSTPKPLESHEPSSSKTGSRPQTHREHDERPQSEKQPLSTLTMFAISMQKFTKSNSPIKNDNKVLPKSIQGYRSFTSLRCFSSPAYLRKDRQRRPRRPATERLQELKDGEVIEAQDIPVMRPEVVYAMQLRNRRLRSRRELQELSKMEHEEKYGKVDRSDEIKQKRFDWAKCSNQLNTRIKSFITDVDNFNKQQSKPDYLITNIVRSKTFAN